MTKYNIELSRSGEEHPAYNISAYGKNYEEAIDEAKRYVVNHGFWPLNSSVESRMKSINVCHVISDNSAIKNIQTMSACSLDLICGIAGIYGIILSIVMVIRECILYGITDALGIAFPMMILVLISLLLSTRIRSYMIRESFEIYFIDTSNYSDIEYIKKKYMVVEVNEEFIAFVEKENFNNWYSFEVHQDIRKLYHANFKED